MSKKTDTYAGYRYPAEIISHAVWLYVRFTLSFRDVEKVLAPRGIIVSPENFRPWTLKFGRSYAHALRHRQPKRGDKSSTASTRASTTGPNYRISRPGNSKY